MRPPLAARLLASPAALVALTLAGYLLYFHAVASAPHSVALFSWLPLGGWKATSPVAEALLYATCIGGLFALYASLLGTLSSRPAGRRDRLVVFGGAALFCVTLIFQPSLLSRDLFDYMGHGRVMVVHGANPFSTPAASLPADEFTRAMGWSGATPLYGPVWASLSGLLVMAGGGSFLATVVVFKLFFGAIHLLGGFLILKVAQGWRSAAPAGLRPLTAAAFYLWNPLVLTQSAGDAHNDGVVLMWLLLGVWMFQRRDDLLGAATSAMSVMVKYVTAPVLVLLAIARYREDGARRALLAAATAAVVAALAYAPYLGGLDPVHFLRPYEHSSYQGGLMMMVEMSLGTIIRGANTPDSPLAAAMRGVSLIAAAALGLWFLRECLRVRTLRDAVQSSTRLLLLYLLLVTALLRTSYVIWIVGLAALVAAVPLRRAVAIFSCTVMALEVLWVWRLLLGQPAPPISFQRFAASAVAVGPPILYLLLHSRRLSFARWARPGERTTA